jgi:folate-dependent phosphoribosylglycinamide formyltransferase PurN
VLRVAVITPSAAPHSRSLCAVIAERHELVGVLHPARSAPTRAKRLRQLRAELRRLGPLEESLRVLGTSRSPLRGWDLRQDTGAALADAFPDANARYEQRVAAVAEPVEDVNGPAAIARLKALSPDVVCCLGGPIYRAPLIASVPLMLNFHSGVSPIYNGADTIAQAFANGHLALCGGTLMTMSPTVDGGDVLGHVLPAIASGDTPGRLFARTAAGAIDAYLAALDHLDGGRSLAGVPQPPPLFYLRASDWTAVHGHRVRRLVARDAAADAVRDGRIASYWDAGDRDEAARRLRDTLAPLVGL